MIKKLKDEEFGECFTLVLEDCKNLQQLQQIKDSLQKILSLFLEQCNTEDIAYYAYSLSEIIRYFAFSAEIPEHSWGLVEKIIFDNNSQ